ncbi:hypothetical protein [Hymenobacter sp. 102]|uniref:hypothetical protein n=1 Tax=Hymenobacter sp. 102 TaxID=3403152 RepID=UPI003CEC35F5
MAAITIHNIGLDLNKGAGGEYIYLSFTRDPFAVAYQRNGSCGDEQPKDASGQYLNYPITSVDTRVVGNTGTLIKCFNGYTPMWAVNPLGNFEGNYMKFPDLNDGAGGSYVYGYQSRSQSYGTPIELGILAGNNVNIQPPAGSGYVRVGSDLNSGAGGDYIFFCIKHR